MALVVGFIAFILLGSPLGLLALIGGALIEVGELVFWSRFLRRYRIRSGPEALVGMRGEALSECRPEGTVRVHGAIWRARCPAGAVSGEEVVVEAIEGLTLTVAPTGRRMR